MCVVRPNNKAGPTPTAYIPRCSSHAHKHVLHKCVTQNAHSMDNVFDPQASRCCDCLLCLRHVCSISSAKHSIDCCGSGHISRQTAARQAATGQAKHRAAESTQQYGSFCASAMQLLSRQLPYAEVPRLRHALHSSAGNNAALKS
jgi:hypothetical protein